MISSNEITPRTTTTVPERVPADLLTQVWSRPPDISGWLTAVNHRAIGLRYIVTSFIFFLLAGIIALIMRIQLAQPQLEIISPELYNQMFTMHGTTMMFLFAVPMVEGVGIYFVPLMIGTRDMAFPRLNAFGYWVYLFAGVVLYASFFAGVAPDSGWFNYVPLTGPGYSPGIGIDFWVTMITFLEVAALVAAVELVVTIIKMRAPGMSLNRIPLFVWSALVTSVMIIFAMPPLMVVSVLLALDRTIGTHFFNVAAGGDPLLWQHLFWFFGHPDVYIILLPGLGIVSAIVVVFSRASLVGYTLLVISIVSIGFLSFGLWVHHMFATGIRLLGMSFFTAASVMIAIPSGIQIFAWIGTMWSGKVRFTTPMLFVFGFIFIFVLGGLTGVMVALIPFDWQVHDSYFIVAHFHYVLIGGMLFPLFGGFYFWLPKVTGRKLSETLGHWNFWVMFVGFNLSFFFMHILGFYGMPRRVYSYLPGLGWDLHNAISTVGAFLFAFGVLIFLVNLVYSQLWKKDVENNPWGADTLDWLTSSPPEQYNFRTIPIVRSREPLWDQAWGADYAGLERGEGDHVLLPLQESERDTVGTTLMDAKLDTRIVLPKPTIWPLLAALAATFTFISSMINLILVPIGALLVYAAIIGWTWPRDMSMRDESSTATVTVGGSSHTTVLPRWVSGSRSVGWWGILFLVIIEVTVFGSLISSYFYLRAGVPQWPPDGIEPSELFLPTLNSILLLASVIPMYWAVKQIKQGSRKNLLIGLATVFFIGLIFLVLKYVEYSDKPYTWETNAYGSIVWTVVGFHTAHVIATMLKIAAIWVAAWKGFFNAERHVAVEGNALYWYFVVGIWAPLYVMLYWAPRWL
jgi:cytochrome c oxidase subunit I+III